MGNSKTPAGKAYGAEARLNVRLQVFKHYGMSCACCGESDIYALTIDHTNGGGNEHRREMIRNGKPKSATYGEKFYRQLIRDGFPQGYRALCWNCNAIAGAYGEKKNKLPWWRKGRYRNFIVA